MSPVRHGNAIALSSVKYFAAKSQYAGWGGGGRYGPVCFARKDQIVDTHTHTRFGGFVDVVGAISLCHCKGLL